MYYKNTSKTMSIHSDDRHHDYSARRKFLYERLSPGSTYCTLFDEGYEALYTLAGNLRGFTKRESAFIYKEFSENKARLMLEALRQHAGAIIERFLLSRKVSYEKQVPIGRDVIDFIIQSKVDASKKLCVVILTEFKEMKSTRGAVELIKQLPCNDILAQSKESLNYHMDELEHFINTAQSSIAVIKKSA